MKKILLLFTFLAFYSFSVFSQDVPPTQRSLITKIAADWCPPCGGWGWTFFENLVDDNAENAVLIVAHHDGGLTNDVAQAFNTNLGAVYQPFFYFNNTDGQVSSGNAEAKRIEFRDMVQDLSQSMPIVNAGMTLTLDGDQLDVATKTKFFQEASGEFYIGVYVVEDEVIHSQAGQGSNAVHEKILRGAVTTESFGELLINGTAAVDSEYDHTFSMTLDSDWDVAHLEIITVIWKKENDKYLSMNSNISSTFEAPTSVQDFLLEGVEIKMIPTVTSSETTVSIDLEKNIKAATVELFDLEGRKVMDVFQGDLGIGNTTFTINKNSKNLNGMYFVVLKSNQEVISQRVIFE